MEATKIETPDGQSVDYPARLVTVAQLEDRNPGLKGRVRGFIMRADLNSPEYAGIRDAVIRLGRSVYIDEPRFIAALREHAGKAPAQPRNPDGRAGKKATARTRPERHKRAVA